MEIKVINNVPKIEKQKVSPGGFSSIDLNKNKQVELYRKSKLFSDFLNTIDSCQAKCTVVFKVTDGILIRSIECQNSEDTKLIKKMMEDKWPKTFN